jgi:hypothetical protein
LDAITADFVRKNPIPASMTVDNVDVMPEAFDATVATFADIEVITEAIDDCGSSSDCMDDELRAGGERISLPLS